MSFIFLSGSQKRRTSLVIFLYVFSSNEGKIYMFYFFLFTENVFYRAVSVRAKKKKLTEEELRPLMDIVFSWRLVSWAIDALQREKKSVKNKQKNE